MHRRLQRLKEIPLPVTAAKHQADLPRWHGRPKAAHAAAALSLRKNGGNHQHRVLGRKQRRQEERGFGGSRTGFAVGTGQALVSELAYGDCERDPPVPGKVSKPSLEIRREQEMEAPGGAHIFLTVQRAPDKTVFRASVLRKRTLSGRYCEFDATAELGQVSGRTCLGRSTDGQRTATCEAADINR